MQTDRVYRLGTRASLLAVAQSRQVAALIEAANPGARVELVTCRTRGDRDLQTPLHAVADPDFFSAELDVALAQDEVDFCVHSWKDLASNRPDNFVCAAVPQRALPHDAILFRADIVEHIKNCANNGTALKIGSSSHRRRINVGDFLPTVLPGPDVELAFEDLRGPVHERLARISASAGDERLDGVVLALAGLQRLWADPDGQAAIAPLLAEARWMLLPLSEVPVAPGQGALAIECRRDDAECQELLTSIHNPRTATLLEIESALIAEHAGEHPEYFGASACDAPALGYVAQMRGCDPATQIIKHITQTGIARPPKPRRAKPWLGQGWITISSPLADTPKLIEANALFIAHSDAASGIAINADLRCWTSGVHSWRNLAKAGIWVEGCGDNLGFAALKPIISEPILQLPRLEQWAAITHLEAVDSWSSSGITRVLASCSKQTALDQASLTTELAGCTHFFWSSTRQYEALREWLPENSRHACGTGKTYRGLVAAGLYAVQPFSSRKEWQQWLA